MYIQLVLAWYFLLSPTFSGGKLLSKTPVRWAGCKLCVHGVALMAGGKAITPELGTLASTSPQTQPSSLPLQCGSKQAYLPEA